MNTYNLWLNSNVCMYVWMYVWHYVSWNLQKACCIHLYKKLTTPPFNIFNHTTGCDITIKLQYPQVSVVILFVCLMVAILCPSVSIFYIAFCILTKKRCGLARRKFNDKFSHHSRSFSVMEKKGKKKHFVLDLSMTQRSNASDNIATPRSRYSDTSRSTVYDQALTPRSARSGTFNFTRHHHEGKLVFESIRNTCLNRYVQARPVNFYTPPPHQQKRFIDI